MFYFTCDRSLSGRSDLHLSELERVLATTPSSPVDSLSCILMWATQVETVEIGLVASVRVPPSSLGHLRTVHIGRSVIVTVECRECRIMMSLQRISYNSQ